MLLISEDLDEVLELCDRIGVMYRGRLWGLSNLGPATPTRSG